MGHKLAIDFGTTNSVIARWNPELETSEIVGLPTLSLHEAERPSLVPSLLYVHDARAGRVTLGQAVREQKLDAKQDNRLFRNFKRGIVTSPAPDPRPIDGLNYGDKDAGRAFVKGVLGALPFESAEIEQLVLTAPVASFESYLSWLNELIDEIAPDKVRVVDESTAAALGYAVTEPGAVVLVFDFGGGTLDLSLVQLPENRDKTGGILQRLVKRTGSGQHTARVIAKAGKIIGGSDIDQWILAEVLKRTGVSTKTLGANYAALLTACEIAKIHLSSNEAAEIAFTADKDYQITLTRTELEAILEENGFSQAIRRIVDKVMHVGHQRGIFKEDINYVLLVGGTSLMPAVQRTLKGYFTDMAVRSDKPFTAVAEGALQIAAGFGLDDYLAHSYGIRHLDANGLHQWDEIIPMGSRYPTQKPIEVMLGSAHPNQTEIEFMVGEIDSDSIAMLEVKYEDGQAVFVAQGGGVEQKILPLNAEKLTEHLARLTPPGQLDEDRLKALFSIDDRRQLRLTVIDLHNKKHILDDVVLATLR